MVVSPSYELYISILLKPKRKTQQAGFKRKNGTDLSWSEII